MLIFLALGAFVGATRHLTEDEIATLRLIRGFTTGEIVAITAAWDVHPPLSYLVFDALDRVAGGRDRLLLLPGLLLNAAAAAWFYRRARAHLAGAAWLWLATFLSPPALMWGISIRWYALFLPVVTWALGLVLFGDLARRRVVIGTTALLILATWLGHLGLVIAGLAAIVALRRGVRASRLAVTCAAAYVAAILLAIRMLATNQHDVLDAVATTPLAATLATATAVLNGEAVFPLEPTALVHAAIAGTLLLVALARPPARWSPALLLVVVAGAVLAGSGMGLKLRNAAFVWPWANLVVAQTLTPRIRPRAAWVLAALALAFFVHGAINLARGSGMLKGRANLPVAAAVALADSLRATNADRGTVVLTHEPALAYALERRGLRVDSPFTTWPWPAAAVPHQDGDLLIAFDSDPGSYDRAAYERRRADVARLLAGAPGGGTRRLGHDRWHAWRARLSGENDPRQWQFEVTWGQLAAGAVLRPYPRVPLPGVVPVGLVPWVDRSVAESAVE